MQISVRAVEGEGGHKTLQKIAKVGEGSCKYTSCILHIAQVARQDKTIAAILAELNYKGTDFNLDYK